MYFGFRDMADWQSYKLAAPPWLGEIVISEHLS